jgi:hypothetical protein
VAAKLAKQKFSMKQSQDLLADCFKLLVYSSDNEGGGDNPLKRRLTFSKLCDDISQ